MTKLATALLAPLALILILCFNDATRAEKPDANPEKGNQPVRLGNFSVSLSVKDLDASKAFYEKLGFKAMGGAPGHYLIMQNETATIGLFHGFFEGNILTFNPGWDRNAQTLPDYDDVRDIQRILQDEGIKLTTTANPDTTGPESITLTDPDGNQILIDQHAPSPNAE